MCISVVHKNALDVHRRRVNLNDALGQQRPCINDLLVRYLGPVPFQNKPCDVTQVRIGALSGKVHPVQCLNEPPAARWLVTVRWVTG